jgi:hypothetical protein
MKRVVVPLALVFSASLALACPGSKKEMDAQAPASAQLAAVTAQPAATTTPAVSVKQQDTQAVSKKTPAAETAKKTTGS